jgi:hypothetical protein
LLSDDELADLGKDYSRRWSAAQARTRRAPWPTDAWAGATDGPLLASLEFETVVDAAVEEVEDPSRLTIDPVHLYGGDLDASPQWVMIGAGFRQSRKGSEPGHTVMVLTRDGDDAPWRAVGEVGVGPDELDLPFPLAEGDPTATDDQREATDDVVGDLVTFWESGRQPDSVTVSPTLRDAVEESKALSATEVDRVSVGASSWPGEATYVVRSADGALALTTLQVEVRLHAAEGRVLYWREPFSAIFGSERADTLRVSSQVTSLLRIPDGDRTATYLGQNLDQVGNRAAPNV